MPTPGQSARASSPCAKPASSLLSAAIHNVQQLEASLATARRHLGEVRVAEFWAEFENRFTWDLLPFLFLYDLYAVWSANTAPAVAIMGRNGFIDHLLVQVASRSDWCCHNRGGRVRPGSRMAVTEPLVAEFALADWVSCATAPRSHYSGLLRVKQGTPLRQ